MVGSDLRPLVAHVVYRFDVGGLENGVVNLINRMTRYRHAVIALTEAVPEFCRRIERDDVAFVSLGQPPGHGYKTYPALLRQLKDLQPSVVHTRNLAALEMQAAAWWTGVPARVHGEHGRDVEDLAGTSRRHQWMRRAYRPFVHHYVALSRDLESYLKNRVGVPRQRISQIFNGVDQDRFAPVAKRLPIAGSPFVDPSLWLVGTVGRMQSVKAQHLLAEAFVSTLKDRPELRQRLRLVLVGGGPLRAQCQSILREGGVEHLAWLPGERSDVPDVMRGLDCFVLPSLAEGISNTILEAMACGLPVIATDVGGNADLVEPGVSGELVPAGSADALAGALARWAADPERAVSAGRLGRLAVERRFSLSAMVLAYESLYDRLLLHTSKG